MANKPAIVKVDTDSRSTVTTIGQQSHLINKVEKAIEEIARREEMIPNEVDTKKTIKTLKEKINFTTDDILILGVIYFLVSEGYQDKTLISTLFWIFSA